MVAPSIVNVSPYHTVNARVLLIKVPPITCVALAFSKRTPASFCVATTCSTTGSVWFCTSKP